MYKQRLMFDASKFQEMYDHVVETCNWLKHACSRTYYKKEDAMTELGKVKDEKNIALKHVTKIQELFESIHQKVTKEIQQTVYFTKDYMDGTITKITLATAFDRTRFRRAKEDVDNLSQHLVQEAKEYVVSMIKGRENFRDFYSLILNLDLPVLNRHTK